MFKVDRSARKLKQAHKQGDHKGVIDHAEVVLLARPGAHDVWKLKGVSHFALGEWKKCYTSLLRACEGIRGDLEINLCMARALVRMGDEQEYRGQVGEARRLHEEALARCEFALEVYPNDFRVYACRSLALMGLGRYEDALRDSDRARRLNTTMPHLRPNSEMLRKIVAAVRRGERIERIWSGPDQMRLTVMGSFPGLAKTTVPASVALRRRVFAGRSARAAA